MKKFTKKEENRIKVINEQLKRLKVMRKELKDLNKELNKAMIMPILIFIFFGIFPTAIFGWAGLIGYLIFSGASLTACWLGMKGNCNSGEDCDIEER